MLRVVESRLTYKEHEMTIHIDLQPGQTLTKTFTVKEEHTASHIGSGSVQVLATPVMIAFMEITSLQLIQEHLPEGYTSVGTHLDVRHLAPTPLGSQVEVRASIETVENLKVILQVEAREGQTLVGSGAHERFIIEVARFLKRVQQGR